MANASVYGARGARAQPPAQSAATRAACAKNLLIRQCYLSPSSSINPCERMKTLRRGAGTRDEAPFTDRQMISLSSASGARSASEKSIAADSAAPLADDVLRSSSGTLGTNR